VVERHRVFLKFCFFFSSRRRHTRSKRDWSSDVCSSDLDVAGAIEPEDHHLLRVVHAQAECGGVDDLQSLLEGVAVGDVLELARRSEERRVGKEGRSRRAAKRLKEKMTVSGCVGQRQQST